MSYHKLSKYHCVLRDTLLNAAAHLFTNSLKYFYNCRVCIRVTEVNLSLLFPFLGFFPGWGITSEMLSTSCEMPGLMWCNDYCRMRRGQRGELLTAISDYSCGCTMVPFYSLFKNYILHTLFIIARWILEICNLSSAQWSKWNKNQLASRNFGLGNRE